jgi:hypothetical protein
MKYKHLPATGWLGFIRDGFTTILNARWYVLVILFSALYCLSWLFFGLTWWGTDAAYLAASNESCVPSLDGFSSAFLFSLETQVTIGYGHRYITQNCSFGIILLIIQCITGLFLDSFLLGLIFTKITRPRNRRKTILFSNQACITTRNGQNYFEFRIADARKTSSLVEAHVRLQLYWYKKDSSGGNVLHQADMEVGYDDGTDRVILLTPVIVSHRITESSPLYTLTAENLLSHDIEVVVVLEGIVESTGLTAQALWSYTEEEIMYGYQFVPITYRNFKEKWEVDFSKFSHMVRSSTPATEL